LYCNETGMLNFSETAQNYIHTAKNLADPFTNGLSHSTYSCSETGMLNFSETAQNEYEFVSLIFLCLDGSNVTGYFSDQP
jgi:hypothetical protein